MSLLLVQYDRHADRIVASEPTELPLRFAKREVMKRNTSKYTRPSPFLVWQVRELGELAQPLAAVSDLIAALDASIANQKARVAS